MTMKLQSIESVLLDIEGTVSPVSFVYDVLFPFARERASDFLNNHWDEPDTQKSLEYMAKDAGFETAASWFEAKAGSPQEIVLAEVNRLMDADIKATGLKELQGVIWKTGYAKGLLTSELFDDVPDALQSWSQTGFDVSIYSSGSIGAQKTFFAHTKYGDMTKFLNSHFDTTSGGKKHSESYETIGNKLGIKLENIVFLSDIVDELDAASKAGLKTALVVRKGNAPQPDSTHTSIKSLAELDLLR